MCWRLRPGKVEPCLEQMSSPALTARLGGCSLLANSGGPCPDNRPVTYLGQNSTCDAQAATGPEGLIPASYFNDPTGAARRPAYFAARKPAVRDRRAPDQLPWLSRRLLRAVRSGRAAPADHVHRGQLLPGLRPHGLLCQPPLCPGARNGPERLLHIRRRWIHGAPLVCSFPMYNANQPPIAFLLALRTVMTPPAATVLSPGRVVAEFRGKLRWQLCLWRGLSSWFLR